ncbi:hypothetical protein [Streptomyces xanthophaeus]
MPLAAPPPVTVVIDRHDDAIHTHTALAAHHPPSGRSFDCASSATSFGRKPPPRAARARPAAPEPEDDGQESGKLRRGVFF